LLIAFAGLNSLTAFEWTAKPNQATKTTPKRSYNAHHADHPGENMKLVFLLVAIMFVAITAPFTRAQTTQPPVGPAAPVKVAIIDADAFPDPKAGVKKLLNALTQVDNGLGKIRNDLVTKNNRLQALAQKANAGTITQAEADEANSLKVEIQRGQEDGQKQQELLTRQYVGPVLNELSTALQAYVKQRGFDMVLDVSKMQNSVMLVNQSLDITDAFIADFNAKNPGTATAPVKP
jgi:Skp family chaperone for outer membrane proteins